MKRTCALILLLAGLAGCGALPDPAAGETLSVQVEDTDPAGEVLVRVRKALEARQPRTALLLLDALEGRSLRAREQEDLLFYQAQAHYLANRPRMSFERLKALASRFPVTRHGSQAAWMEYQIGRYLLANPPTVLGLFPTRGPGLEALRHVTIYWPDQTEPGNPGNQLADDALALLGDHHWKDEAWQDAIARYTQLVTRYASSEWATLAYLRIALSWFNLIQGPAYDRRTMAKAERELQQFLSLKKGTPEQRENARKRLAQTREMLAGRCLHTARYYITLDSPRGVVLNLQETIELYPGTKAAAEARKLLPRWEKRLPLAPKGKP